MIVTPKSVIESLHRISLGLRAEGGSLDFQPFSNLDSMSYSGADPATAQIARHGDTEVIVDKDGGEVHIYQPDTDGLGIHDPDMYGHHDPDVVRGLRPQDLNHTTLTRLGFKQL